MTYESPIVEKKVDEFGAYYKQLLRKFAEEDPILEKNDISSIVNTILRRKRFFISNFEVFTKGFMNLCCRHRKRLIKDSTWQRYRLIEKAEHMLNRKLDILELLKTVQRNQTLLSAMLAPE